MPAARKPGMWIRRFVLTWPALFALTYVALVGFAVAAALGACIDAPLAESPPLTRIQLDWDPRLCGAPHRVVLELEDEAGTELAGSTPCARGALSLDGEAMGIYLGRLYAWSAGAPIGEVIPVRLEVDEPHVRWFLQEPP